MMFVAANKENCWRVSRIFPDDVFNIKDVLYQYGRATEWLKMKFPGVISRIFHIRKIYFAANAYDKRNI